LSLIFIYRDLLYLNKAEYYQRLSNSSYAPTAMPT
jgi:hypothetical protein